MNSEVSCMMVQESCPCMQPCLSYWLHACRQLSSKQDHCEMGLGLRRCWGSMMRA
jgi:hypothetical protein